MVRTEWKAPGVFKADAEKVSNEIQKIGETVTPAEMIEFAKKHKKSELYKCFEWDDSIAAEKYRIEQAKSVLRMLVIVTENEETPPVRVFSHAIPENTYMPTRTFLVNQDEYKVLLQRALNELKAFRAKYKTLTELEAVFEAIDTL